MRPEHTPEHSTEPAVGYEPPAIAEEIDLAAEFALRVLSGGTTGGGLPSVELGSRGRRDTD